MEFIQFDSRSRRQEKPGPASSPERVRRRPGAARPHSVGPLTPTPGAAGVAQHSAAEAAGPETCVRVPGLECGGERPPKGGAPRHRVVQSRKRWAVAGARPRSPSEAGRGVV